jgi:hypothetical protein
MATANMEAIPSTVLLTGIHWPALPTGMQYMSHLHALVRPSVVQLPQHLRTNADAAVVVAK